MKDLPHNDWTITRQTLLGREDDTYFASVKLKGHEWIEMEKVRQTYGKGYLVFGTSNEHVESVVIVDWIRIDSVGPKCVFITKKIAL